MIHLLGICNIHSFYLHDVGVVHLPLPDSCPVVAVFKHGCIVVHIQQADGDPAGSCLQPIVSQHHQMDLRAHLKVQRVIFLHTDLAWMRGKR